MGRQLGSLSLSLSRGNHGVRARDKVPIFGSGSLVGEGG